ncbi:hypothetical protein SAMN04487948_1145 [Halogranum amylolyticum]|uniref:Uncharacterized protein n=2 Tax=Halogranum amylolyticum TaxID=660520 RepID=A0A1H8V367_9EURY|nr:hypothetical protein SAMN04487948_1145 [Halogranum amylolyticum]
MTLSRLHDQGFVCDKGAYWAIRLGAYDSHTTSLIALAAVSEQFEGDCYNENPDWDTNLPDLDEYEDTDADSEQA